MSILTRLIELLTAPLLVFILMFLDKFHLPPIAKWSGIAPIAYPLFALVGSTFSLLLPRGPVRLRTRRVILGISFTVFVVFLFAYIYGIVNSAPRKGYEAAYDIAAIVLCVGTYVSAGFLVAEVAKRFTEVAMSQRKKA